MRKRGRAILRGAFVVPLCPREKLRPRTLTQPCKDEELRPHSPRYLYPKHVITGSPSRGLPSYHPPTFRFFMLRPILYSPDVVSFLFFATPSHRLGVRPLSLALAHAAYVSRSPFHHRRLLLRPFRSPSAGSLFLSSETGSEDLKYLTDRNILRFRERASRPDPFGGANRPPLPRTLLSSSARPRRQIRKNVHANLILPLTLTLRAASHPLSLLSTLLPCHPRLWPTVSVIPGRDRQTAIIYATANRDKYTHDGVRPFGRNSRGLYYLDRYMAGFRFPLDYLFI